MKPIVFLSYLGDETYLEAGWIYWYLHDYRGWKVHDYRRSTASANGPTKDVLKGWLKQSDLFIQILKTTLGSANLAISELPILQWERDTFLDEHKGDYASCLFLSLQGGDSLVQNYLADMCSYTTPKNPSSVHNMLGEVMTFVEHRQAMFDGLSGGVLDLESAMELLDIRKAVQANRLDPNNAILKQKHLYASPYAARLWIDLTTNTKSQLKHVYAKYPFDNDKTRRSELKKVQEEAKGDLREWFDEHRASLSPQELNVIVLGGGDGIRELKTCRWIAKEFDIETINALLVDISVDLLCVAVKKFQEVAITSFAIIDIEQRPVIIREVRRRTIPTGPGIFIFLGPTLCNVAESAFLEDLCKNGMESGDLIFCEVLLCKEVKAEGPIQVENDERFDFITSPLLTLGLKPDRKKFYEETTPDRGNKSVSKVWYYQEEEDKSRYNLATVKAMLPDFCKKSFEAAGFQVHGLVKYEYRSQNGKAVTMGYVIAKKK